MQLNASRIKVLQAQDDLVNKMKDDAMTELLRVSHNHHEYKNLLKDLIVQVWTNTAYTNFDVPFLKNFYKSISQVTKQMKFMNINACSDLKLQ